MRRAAAAALLATAAILVGCGGDSGKETATQLKITAVEAGGKASFALPKSVEGGLVELTLANQGKAPHGVQLVRFEGDHTAAEALEQVESESEETPDWLRAEGGTGGVLGGETGTATLNLEPGSFVIADSTAFGEHGPTAELQVTDGDSGDLPGTDGEVVAAETGDDEYEWDVSGLKSGKNAITFKSEGDEAIHLVIAAPIKGKAPSQSELEADFSKEGPPPPYLSFEGSQTTAVLDGGKSQTAELDLKPGKYVFFCPLTDRDGGKPHDQEGLLSIETVE